MNRLYDITWFGAVTLNKPRGGIWKA